MSADASNYDLQNVKYQSQNLNKITKRAITNLSDVSKALLMSPETSAGMWFYSRLRHNAFR